MKKTLSILIVIATIFCFNVTPAFAYDGPTFLEVPEANEKTWKFFNPETVDLFYRPDAELSSEAFICPYDVSMEVAYHAFIDSQVHIYAYFNTFNQSEGTWLLDNRGNKIDFSGHTYEGYNELGVIYLSDGVVVRPSSEGFQISSTEKIDFEECPYEKVHLMTSEEFSKEVKVKVYSYTFDGEPGVWMTDDLGHTADFRNIGYFTTVSNHTIELVDGNRTVLKVYPTASGFKSEFVSSAIG